MEDTTQPTASPTITEPLVRPIANRIISGAALAVSNRLGVSATVVRVVWAMLAFTGVGIPLYLVAWLLIPGEGESQSLGEQWMSRLGTSQGWIGVVLVLVAIAILTPALPFVDGGILIPTILLAGGILLYQRTASRAPNGTKPVNPSRSMSPRTPKRPSRPVTPPSPLGQITFGATVIGLGALALVDRATPVIEAAPRHYLALAVTILGLGVLVGTFFGRARWLIPFGLLLIPATAGAGVIEYENAAREQTLRPTTFAELETAYEFGVGDLTIDLTQLPWNDETVNLDASVGVGRLELIVPPDVAIEAATEVGIGASANPTTREGGLGVDFDYSTGGGTGGKVVANLEVGIGEIEVRGSDFAGFIPTDGLFFGPGDDLNIAPISGDRLRGAYRAEGDSDLTLDLTNLVLRADRSLVLQSEHGDIVVSLPEEGSYSITAVGPDLVIFDNEQSGTYVTEFLAEGQPVLSIAARSSDGTITFEKGSRS